MQRTEKPDLESKTLSRATVPQLILNERYHGKTSEDVELHHMPGVPIDLRCRSKARSTHHQSKQSFHWSQLKDQQDTCFLSSSSAPPQQTTSAGGVSIKVRDGLDVVLGHQGASGFGDPGGRQRPKGLPLLPRLCWRPRKTLQGAARHRDCPDGICACWR